ncbi:hypothetical protein F4V43_04070 [Paenibacillus spiritus]|uniref:S-layer homology domain-containing protein n=1 Tax=Paenibacillus spiritus TaxID=2496557 RepID=A0A5J5GHU3_9BACL|nr:S-layer homology domain-containing protein [Paenibacillus spiritus]KAA9007667.1 hypothetical protein F4V43_04070 [Paenibacillus spiritus]
MIIPKGFRQVLKRALTVLTVISLVVPFYQGSSASAGALPLYDTMGDHSTVTSATYDELAPGTYYATPFQVGNAYAEISNVYLKLRYEEQGSYTSAESSVAIYSDDNGRPGTVLMNAEGTSTLADNKNVSPYETSYRNEFFGFPQPGAKLYPNHKYWIVYGNSDDNADNLSRLVVERNAGQTAPHQYGSSAGIKEDTLTTLTVSGAGTQIGALNFSGAAEIQDQIVPVMMVGWESKPVTDLSVSDTTESKADLSFTQKPGATELWVEQSQDNINWTRSRLNMDIPLHQYSSYATVTGLVPGKHYYFRLNIKDGRSGGLSNVAEATMPDFGWRIVGKEGITDYQIKSPSIAVDKQGTPYIAFVNSAMTGKVTVMKFNGTAWEEVGDPVADNLGNAYVSLALDSTGTPYVAYRDNDNDSRATVKKWENGQWVLVGNPGFTSGQANQITLKLDRSDRPYLAYQDYDYSRAGARSGAVTVMTFADGSWTVTGDPQFSEGGSTVESLAFDLAPDGTPYAAYTSETDNKYLPYLAVYKDNRWETIGGAPADATGVGYESKVALAVNPVSGTPFIAFKDQASGSAIVVKEWKDGAWNPVGAGTATPWEANELTLGFDPAGTPYLAYTEMQEGAAPLNVRKWTGTVWEQVGAENFSAGRIYLPGLAFDPEGRPYAAYIDRGNSDSITVKVFPKPISDLKAAETAEGYKLTFSPATGATSVAVEYSADGVNWQTATLALPVDAASVSAVVTGLPAGTAYQFRLAVWGGAKEGLSNTAETRLIQTVQPVSALPGSGQVTAGTTVALSTATEGATIYYTLDGSVPTTSSPAYTGPITVSENVTIKAYAVKDGMIASEVKEWTYTVEASSPVSTPVATAAATVPNSQITLKVVDGSGQALQTPLTQTIGSSLPLTGQLLNAGGQSLGSVTIKPGGQVSMPNVPAGTYKLPLQVVAPNGQKLAGTVAKVTVDAAGNVSISAELIDPYGIITDSVTGKPVDGVKVTLHWSDTALNRAKGRTVDALVELPELPDFAPNRNLDPQTSVKGGQYGWMVYPEGDYYILAEKDGYEVYDSRKDTRSEQQGEDSYIKDGIIHVGQSIVEHSFKINPAKTGSGTHTAYIKGYPDGSFKPENGISRAELAAILGRTMTKNAPVKAAASFKDVAAKHWAAKDIAAARAQGWMTGYAGGAFKPEGKVTRAELAQTLANIYGWKAAGSASFADAQGHWAGKAIAALAEQGLINGYGDGTFRPDQAVTRTEAVKIFNRLLKRSTGDKVGVTPVWSDVKESHGAYTDIMEASVGHGYNAYATGTEEWTNR